MSFYSIAAKYNGPLEAAHAFIDDDRYDMDSWCAAGELKMDLSDQQRVYSIASTYTSRLRSANVFLFYNIAAKYNGPLDAAHAFIDDDRYDMGKMMCCGWAQNGPLRSAKSL